MSIAKKRKVSPRFKFFLLFLCAVYAAIVFFNQETLIRSQNEEIATLTEQKEEAVIENQFSEENISYVTSNEYIEKVAREKLGWIMEGEIKFKES
ncbi:MAG: septum formation initiator family protein [Eubacteriales bacterium]